MPSCQSDVVCSVAYMASMICWLAVMPNTILPNFNKGRAAATLPNKVTLVDMSTPHNGPQYLHQVASNYNLDDHLNTNNFNRPTQCLRGADLRLQKSLCRSSESLAGRWSCSSHALQRRGFSRRLLCRMKSVFLPAGSDR